MDLTSGIEVAWASDDQTFMTLLEWIELSLQVEIASLVVMDSCGNFKDNFDLIVMFVHSYVIVVLQVVLPQLFLSVWALL